MYCRHLICRYITCLYIICRHVWGAICVGFDCRGLRSRRLGVWIWESGIRLPGAWIPASGRPDLGIYGAHPGSLLDGEPRNTTRGRRLSNRAVKRGRRDVRERRIACPMWDLCDDCFYFTSSLSLRLNTRRLGSVHMCMFVCLYVRKSA